MSTTAAHRIAPFVPTTHEKVLASFVNEFNQGGDLLCVCGNDATSDGFYYCSPDGQHIESDFGEADHPSITDLNYVYCPTCLRIINLQATSVPATAEDVEQYSPDIIINDNTLYWCTVVGHITPETLPSPSEAPRGTASAFFRMLAVSLYHFGLDPQVRAATSTTPPSVYVEDFFSDGESIEVGNRHAEARTFEATKGTQVVTVTGFSVTDMADYVLAAKNVDTVDFELPTDYAERRALVSGRA